MSNQDNLKQVSRNDYLSFLKGLITLVGDENINGVPLHLPNENMSLMINVHNNQVVSVVVYNFADRPYTLEDVHNNAQYFNAEMFEPGQIKKG